jgi:hypothetical protein
MTDSDLALAYTVAHNIERAARSHWNASTERAEREASLIAVRHATALMRGFEQWISARACRAVMVK